MKEKRNRILNKIKTKVKSLEDTKYEKELEEAEKKKDNQKSYHAVRIIIVQ